MRLLFVLVSVTAAVAATAAHIGLAATAGGAVVHAAICTEAPLTRVSNSFLGVNIDAASLYEGTRLDFRDPKLREMGRVLGQASPYPMTLRVGGSAADDLTFSHANVTIHVSYSYWDEMLDFCNSSGLALSFDLNAMSMRKGGAWDSTEAQSLLEHVRGKDQAVWAFQLGNEPGHWQTRHGGTPGPAEHGADFAALRKLLEETFGNTKAPRIQGPDVCFGNGTSASPCASAEYLSTLLRAAKGSIDDVTVRRFKEKRELTLIARQKAKLT